MASLRFERRGPCAAWLFAAWIWAGCSSSGPSSQDGAESPDLRTSPETAMREAMPCPLGTKVCASRCTAENDPLTGCGSADCVPCGEANGTALCKSGQCAIVCNSGFLDCDGKNGNGCEADSRGDPESCGQCGRSCQGATCANSACEPMVVGTIPCGSAYALVLDDTSAYCTDYQSGTVSRLPKAGGASTVLATGQAQPAGIAMDASFVYWTCHQTSDGKVMKLPLQGGQPSTLATGQVSPGAVAVDDANVYWANWGIGYGPHEQSSVMKVAKTGGTPAVLSTDSSHYVTSVTVDSANVYWSVQPGTGGNGALMRTSKSGGSPVMLYQVGSTPEVVVTDGESLFWRAWPLGPVQMGPSAGGSVTTLASAAQGYGGLAIDVQRKTLYWTTDDGELKRFVTGAAHPEILSQGTWKAGPIAVDQATVYWASGGKLMRLAK